MSVRVSVMVRRGGCEGGEEMDEGAMCAWDATQPIKVHIESVGVQMESQAQAVSKCVTVASVRVCV